MSHADTEWMKDKPLGLAVDNLRKWGNRWFKHEQTGEAYALTLYFIPDPQNHPDRGFLVCDGRSWRDSEGDAWSHAVGIQLADGETREMTTLELEGYHDKSHWRFQREWKRDRDAAMLAAMQAIGKIKTTGYKQASVTEG